MTKKKKITFSIGIVLLAMLLGLLVGIMTAPKLDAQYWQQQEMESAMSRRIRTVLELIDNNYVDEVNYDSITEQMMNALLTTLDPHSSYHTPSEGHTSWRPHYACRYHTGVGCQLRRA